MLVFRRTFPPPPPRPAPGLVPANFFHVSTGYKLSTLSTSVADNTWTFVQLFCLQFLALLPTLFKRRLQQLDSTPAKSKRQA